MEMIGYSLVDGDGNELQKWGDTKGQLMSPPAVLILPNGDHVHGFKVGDVLAGGLTFVERWLDDPSPASSAEVARDVTFDGDKIVVSVAYAPPTQDELVAYASNARYAKEIGGIVVADVPVATDDRSKQMILGARVAADVDPDFATLWVGADGIIYPITAAAMIMISNAVLAHVAACFATFTTVKAQIDVGTITTAAQIDAAFGS